MRRMRAGQWRTYKGLRGEGGEVSEGDEVFFFLARLVRLCQILEKVIDFIVPVHITSII